MTLLIDHRGNSPSVATAARPLLADLLAEDDWLPPETADPLPTRYAQYLLHCDPLERFSVVSFVWGPGQRTPVHDHTVWGLVGVLRGVEISCPYVREADGALRTAPEARLEPGDIEILSPEDGDIHQVSNGLDSGVSISIHVYGGNIGAVSRHTFDPATGAARSFISSYTNASIPNIWS
jgi:predicted metal-dependent enzyme (double-stranded beta helix superfamily)